MCICNTHILCTYNIHTRLCNYTFNHSIFAVTPLVFFAYMYKKKQHAAATLWHLTVKFWRQLSREFVSLHIIFVEHSSVLFSYASKCKLSARFGYNLAELFYFPFLFHVRSEKTVLRWEFWFFNSNFRIVRCNCIMANKLFREKATSFKSFMKFM